MQMKNECYWCGAPATTKEHVPPKCLFPEEKDSKDFFNKSYKNNLITVPSCEQHNNKKSGDDEFLLTVLSLTFCGNSIGYFHSHTKLARAIKRNPHLIKSYLNIIREENIQIDGINFPVAYAKIDNQRIFKCFESIARGIYYHEFGERFKGKCGILPLFLKYEHQSIYTVLSKILNDKQSTEWKIKGTNPDIFTYQFGPVDQYKLRPMKMTFYKNIEVLVAYMPYDNNFPYKLKNM